ncbi:MAG: phospho-sugar mutase [Myxococcota bacterium]
MDTDTDSALRDLVASAEAWIADDPDPETRRELEMLIAERDTHGLAERFAGPLTFGTAGLRGELGAGPARMNQVTVARATAGLARQLIADVPDARDRGVVVGRDGRRGSPELSRVVAEVLCGHGLRVHWIEGPTPTPVCAFAGRHTRAAAVAIVTASHNPPEYNGLKVYAPNGAQIVSPQDQRIQSEGIAAGSISDLPRTPFDAAESNGLLMRFDDALEAHYLGALDGQCQGPVPPPAQVRVVTTALHGVGHRWIEAALRRRGFDDLHPVLEQSEPDGAFPTVTFPNPEEPGALDLSLALGERVDADLVVANDPDTDRLCVAVRRAGRPVRVLSGNELGVLLGDWLLRGRIAHGTAGDDPFLATTIVSTTMLRAVAEASGATCLQTLTGFKWIWDRSLATMDRGGTFIFGFEEALGYCVGSVVRDKDGVGAAQILMELAADLKSRGMTLLDQLDTLYRAHGVYLNHQVSVRLPGLDGRARIDALMAGLRSAPPVEIAQVAVTSVNDLAGPDAEALGLPRSNVIVFHLADRGRVVVRPSGTEPKLKSYLEVREAVSPDEEVADARRRAEPRMTGLVTWIDRVIGGP